MPKRPNQPCTQPGCPLLKINGDCPDHPHQPWAGSKRRAKTLSGSAQQARAQRILKHWGHLCHVCLRPGANEADHVIPLSQGGPDTEDNMRPIHATPCHKNKTQQESAQARWHHN